MARIALLGSVVYLSVMGNIRMYHHTPIYIIILLLLVSCSSSKRITVAFVGDLNIVKYTSLNNQDKKIGYIAGYKVGNDTNSVFVTVMLKKGVKIPYGSKFIYYENLFGPSLMEVIYTENKATYTSKDLATGTFVRMLDKPIRDTSKH
jgi:hypothetical protein